MHEVGHTLGLRHNFKASTMLSLDEMGDPQKTSENGLTASVMDYAPANIVPKGQSQGAFFNGWWWWPIIPSVAMILILGSLALINMGLDELANPRVRRTE